MFLFIFNILADLNQAQYYSEYWEVGEFEITHLPWGQKGQSHQLKCMEIKKNCHQ